MFGTYLTNVRETNPLVHCITNFVTVNDCANIVLACGGSPTMAHHEDETAEITSGCKSLVLNMGNVQDVQAMINAGIAANRLSHPVILDPVGVGASTLRKNVFKELSSSFQISVIRGNASEIKSLATGAATASGVDAAKEDRITEESVGSFITMAKGLAATLGCVISISGQLDIVASADKAYVISNGCADMSRITGTGCMLTSMIGAFCGANPDHMLEATAAAVTVMGVAGDIAKEKTEAASGGTMTFRLHMIDAVSLMDADTLEKRGRCAEWK